VDADAEELSRGIGDIFLRGISAERQRSNTKKGQKKRSVSN
jgi:hypothetical protein